jgi:RNA polymerase subunit RPABC4/transcription elongation factor Spt4
MERIRKRYHCKKCKKLHNTSSKICREHRDYLAIPERTQLEKIIEQEAKKKISDIIHTALTSKRKIDDKKVSGKIFNVLDQLKKVR